jgi:outer membrane protein TolC
MKPRLFVLITAVAAAGLVAFLAGCVTPPRLASATTPWNPPPEARSTDTVWKTVCAQKPDLAKPLTLAELADIALQNNPASRQTWNAARAAAAQVEQAQGYFMPTLVGTAAGNRQYTKADQDTYDQDYLKYGPGLQVNYLIFNFGGGRKAAVEQALQTVYAANYTFNGSLQGILLSVETAYYGLISAQAGIVAAEAGVNDAKTALAAAQDRKTAGVGTDLEVLQAQSLYDKALYGLADAQGQCQIARGALAQALGLPANTALQVAAPTNEVAAALPRQDLQWMIDSALACRSDIAALQATLAAQQTAVKVASSAFWPSLYLNGAISRNYYDALGDKAMQNNDWALAAGVSLQWTLFDGYQNRSAESIARAQADATLAQLQQAELAASADVWNAYHNYETALQKHAFSSAFLKSSAATYNLALDSYKAGLKSILDLLNAESQLAQARSQQIAARQEVFTALANLAYAMGLIEVDNAAQPQDQVLFSTPPRKDNQP